MREAQSDGVGTLVDALNQHSEASIASKVSMEMAISEAMSLMVVELLQALVVALALVEEMPIAIEPTGPSIVASLGSTAQALTSCWLIREDGLSLLDSLKAKELMSSTTPHMDVTLPQCMSIEETLACMCHYAIRVSDTSF